MSFSNNNVKTATAKNADDAKCEKNQKCILFIPGFLSGQDPQKKAKAELQSLFPQCDVYSMSWEESDSSWTDMLWRVKNAADSKETFYSFQIAWNNLIRTSKDLLNDTFFSAKNVFNSQISPSKLILSKWFDSYKKAGNVAISLSILIAAMSTAERENLILVGHSLGAYIVVKTLECLSLRQMKINQAFLLGAAIDGDDSAIPAACRATINPIEYTINYLDWALTLYPLVSKNSALGQLGYTGMQNAEMKKHILFPGLYHDNNIYIKELIKSRKR